MSIRLPDQQAVPVLSFINDIRINDLFDNVDGFGFIGPMLFILGDMEPFWEGNASRLIAICFASVNDLHGQKSPVNVTANVNIMFRLSVKLVMGTLFSPRLAIVIFAILPFGRKMKK